MDTIPLDCLEIPPGALLANNGALQLLEHTGRGDVWKCGFKNIMGYDCETLAFGVGLWCKETEELAVQIKAMYHYMHNLCSFDLCSKVHIPHRFYLIFQIKSIYSIATCKILVSQTIMYVIIM